LASVALVVGVVLAVSGGGLAAGWLLLGALVALFFWKPVHGALVSYTIFSVYPALRVISISIRPSNALLSRSLELIPVGATLQSYVALFQEEDFLLWLWNSLTITIAVSFIGVAIAATSGYATSRWRFPGRRPFLVFLLAAQMIPVGLLVIPIFVIVSQLGLRNNILGLVLAYVTIAVPFSIWVLKGYYDTIPIDLEEAGMVDGCNRMEAFYRIVLPLAAPALSIVFLFNFLSAWSEYIVANVVLSSPEAFTWPLGLNDLIGTFTTDWGKYAAGALIVTLPVLILFVSQSKYLVGGLTIGGVKS
jgi:arabinogalactan oligomer/maltooligosaccharide transport system permease protein